MIFKPKCPGPLYHLSCKAAEDHNVCHIHIASVEWGREEENLKDGVKIIFLRPPSHDSSSNPFSASLSLEIQVSYRVFLLPHDIIAHVMLNVVPIRGVNHQKLKGVTSLLSSLHIYIHIHHFDSYPSPTPLCTTFHIHHHIITVTPWPDI